MLNKDIITVKPSKKWGKEVKTFFIQAQKEFFNWSDADMRLLFVACDNLQTALDCQKQIAKDGMTITTRFGEIKSHPLLTSARDAYGVFIRSVKTLGLILKEDGNSTGRPPGSEKV